jgi:hypothetical protein
LFMPHTIGEESSPSPSHRKLEKGKEASV